MESDPVMIRLRTRSPEETLALGARLGAMLPPGAVVLLCGGLGTGKTVLAKGICSHLGIPPGSVTSPTFTLCNQYGRQRPVEHLDLYRLEEPEEVEDAGLLEPDPDAVVLVEWAQKFPGCFPDHTLRIRLRMLGPEERELILEPGPDGADLIPRLKSLTDESRYMKSAGDPS